MNWRNLLYSVSSYYNFMIKEMKPNSLLAWIIYKLIHVLAMTLNQGTGPKNVIYMLNLFLFQTLFWCYLSFLREGGNWLLSWFFFILFPQWTCYILVHVYLKLASWCFCCACCNCMDSSKGMSLASLYL